jgi:hypothetical protein
MDCDKLAGPVLILLNPSGMYAGIGGDWSMDRGGVEIDG